MGYFSNLDIDREYCRVDRSYPTPAEQLAWKIEDLEERLDLINSGKIHSSSYRILEEELLCVPVGCLYSRSDMEKALEIAREKYLRLLREEEFKDSHALYADIETANARQICLDEMYVGLAKKTAV